MALPAVIQARLRQRSYVPVAHLVELDFVTQARRVSNLSHTITTGGHSWFGIRKLGGIEGLEGSGDLAAAQIRVTVSGVDSRFLATAISADRDEYIGRQANVFLQFFDDDHQPLEDPIARVSYIIDGIEISRVPMDGGGTRRTISVTATNMFYGRGIPRASRFTNVDQQQRYRGDRGLSYLSDLIDTNIPFPW